MAHREVSFIISTSQPTKATESQRRIALSHAARSAHAKARRLRTLQYQAQKRHERHARLSQETPDLPITGLDMFLPADRTDPFMSFARTLSPTEQFLFDHYVTVIIPLMRCNETQVLFSQRMNSIWVPIAITESSLLDIVLLTSSRHLSCCYTQEQQAKQRFFMQVTLQYKSQSLRSLRRAISAEVPALDDATVAKAIMLAYDELYIRNTVMLKHHIDGAVKMVALKGGPQTLGLEGLLEHFLSNLITKMRGDLGVHVTTPWDVC
ncbi:uncharacterized protein BO95DRAFT_454120 [Aspergillus brunneoviolaceus CBS 621.78]|uniref:Uncharacterized protein n=1 Tax=Aspergillus brunneoviolaceus CBS 621.78 TaxID=1450534 RepID=A0ACD1G5V7_9EURO|nr:hypothetical protein BO95DRAFT_454120 [Aspergillus brunneoviolaceus CBS 621.78]RAH44600.1 hypothetical protein BO95DRAFT_454120 [Aspergillus brunneoviolaceus CBS 621.78]